jgi:hypothetical protein
MSYKVIKRYKTHFITDLTGEKGLSYKVINNIYVNLRNISSFRKSYNFITWVSKQKGNPLYFPLFNLFITYNVKFKEGYSGKICNLRSL